MFELYLLSVCVRTCTCKSAECRPARIQRVCLSPFTLPPSFLPFPVSSRQRCPQANGLQSVAPLVRSVEETPQPIPTTIKGTVPSWINGSFLRNGPGKFEFGNDRYNRFTSYFFLPPHRSPISVQHLFYFFSMKFFRCLVCGGTSRELRHQHG